MNSANKRSTNTDTDQQWMQLALNLAEKGRGLTAPNPYVGAVIVKKDKVVGQGYHRKAGSPHAESAALKQAGAKARGATMYVTLEPCCHTGRTGPCAEAIIEAGIAKVHYALKDPNPKVNGRGAKRLRQAGLSVKAGPLRAQAERLNEIYLNRFNRQRPFVILKSAQTLDGRIACANGNSQWISSQPALKLAHQLRAEVDAVVLGARAAQIDNPLLTVRLVKGQDPYRIILSTNATLSPNLKLIAENQDRKTIIATSKQKLPTKLRRAKGLTSWTVKKNGSHLDLTDFLNKAWDFGIKSILVEGGGQLATDFLASGLVDKHIIIIAPLTLGSGIEAVGNLKAKSISEAITYKRQSFTSIGRDVLFSGYPQTQESGS